MTVKSVLAFFLPKARYLFVLLAFCRGLLYQKTACACCLRVMRAGSCIVFYAIWRQYRTVRQLRSAVFAKLFDGSQLCVCVYIQLSNKQNRHTLAAK